MHISETWYIRTLTSLLFLVRGIRFASAILYQVCDIWAVCSLGILHVQVFCAVCSRGILPLQSIFGALSCCELWPLTRLWRRLSMRTIKTATYLELLRSGRALGGHQSGSVLKRNAIHGDLSRQLHGHLAPASAHGPTGAQAAALRNHRLHRADAAV